MKTILLSSASSEYAPKLSKLFSEDADFIFSHNSNSITIFRVLNNIRTHNIRITSNSYKQNTMYIEQHNSAKHCEIKFDSTKSLIQFILNNCSVYFDFYTEHSKFSKRYYTIGDTCSNYAVFKKHVNSILL